MSLVVCPRCNAPNDSPPEAGGRHRCVICNHLWTPQAAAGAAAAAAAPAARPRPGVRVSQEYLPDDRANEAGRALTSRQTAEPGHAIAAGERAKDGAELKPHSDRSHGGVIPPLKALPSKDIVPDPQPPVKTPRQPMRQQANPSGPAVTPSTPTVEVDMDLFDRLERDAQVQRSKQLTVAELTFEPASAPAPSNGQTMACPVCGHTFVASSAARAQTCPQCHTTFDHASGRFATAAASGDGSDPLMGRNLRGCVIDRKLGEGGMGSVYHARQLSLERSVAIKVLPPDLARNRNFIQRFEREAKSLAKINHPNILHIYDFGEEVSLKLYFMIIEFVDGTDLGEVLNRRNTMPQLEVLDLLRQAAMGLEMAAAKGVIHRDIKPDNLMIAGDGVCKVSDFGLAKGYGDENEVTSVGVRVGTPAFMSPEQCDGIEVDWRSDVYNLGCTAYLCLTGRLPFDGETPFSIMLKHKNEAIPSVRDVSPSVEPSVDRLIRRMLAKKPPDRCDSWHALIEEIEGIEVQLSGDPNIMRKTRGQLQALGQKPQIPRSAETRLPTPPPLRPSSSSAREVPPVTSAPASAHRATIPTAGNPPANQLPDWLKPVDMPVSPPAPPPAPPSPVGRTSVLLGGDARSSSTANPVPSRAVASSSNLRAVERPDGRASKRLNAELGAARDRGLRSEAEDLAASAERLFAAGRFEEAGKDFRKAAQLCPDETYSAQLRLRVREARRRGRWSRLAKRSISMVVILGLLAVVAWQATPPLHNLLAEHEYQAITVEVHDLRQRAQALRAFSQEQKPYAWYVTIFKHEYQITAAADALRAAEESERALSTPTVAPSSSASPFLKNLESMLADPSVPLSDVSDRAQILLKSAVGEERDRIQDILTKVQVQFARMTPELHQIEDLIKDHKIGEALERADRFRTDNPRSGKLAADLPLPGRFAIFSEDGHPVEAQVRADGVALASGQHVFCRRGDRDVVLEVAAPGYVPQHLTVAAQPIPGEQLVKMVLKVAPLWSRALGRGLGGPAHLFPASDGLYVQRQDGIALLRGSDGEPLATLDGLPGVQGASYTTLWLEDPVTNRIITGCTDGQVRALDPRTLAVQEVLFRGKAPVLVWMDIPLTFHAGERARYLVEENHGNRRLLALKGAQEWWPYQATRGSQPPILLHALDKVVTIDDTDVHFLEEDGSTVVISSLPAARTGAVIVLGGDAGLLVPTATQVQWLKFGKAEQPLITVDDAALLAAGGGMPVVDGKNLVLAHADSVELLFLDNDHFTSRWRAPLDVPAAWVTLGDGVVVVSDSKGQLTILNADGGQVIGHIVHTGPLSGAPLVRGGLVVVADLEGQVCAYAIAHDH